MKPQLKKCSGFNEDRCKTCKRLDPNAKPLVQSLAESNGKKYCIYYK